MGLEREAWAARGRLASIERVARLEAACARLVGLRFRVAAMSEKTGFDGQRLAPAPAGLSQRRMRR